MRPDIGLRERHIRLGSNEIRLGLQRLLPAKNANTSASGYCGITSTGIGHPAAGLISMSNPWRPDERDWEAERVGLPVVSARRRPLGKGKWGIGHRHPC